MERSWNLRLLEPARWRCVRHLTGDASQRRYSRCTDVAGRTAVLVNYPPSIRAELRRDLEVLEWCRRHEIRVPITEGYDLDHGLALVEDLGETDAETALETASATVREDLLQRMLQPLAALADIDPERLPAWNPPLDRARLRWELAGFELWFVRHHRSRSPAAAVGRWLDGLADEVAGHPRRVCHRDYHLNNLLVPDDGPVAVIDAQDILVGPDTYDAVSLAFERAAVRLLSVRDRRRLLAEWARATAAAPGWDQRAESVRMQRGLKVLGNFARFVVSGRHEYASWMKDLAVRLTPRLEAAGAPPEMAAFLLD
ncbi:MAG: phosphotransferase [Thermoanaerobaculales bacterium]|jgi:aminoglycoside/choline kinase family phosphotransferase|nr:phosphotransferase [Thermoanaerobaculales bacterium]